MRFDAELDAPLSATERDAFCPQSNWVIHPESIPQDGLSVESGGGDNFASVMLSSVEDTHLRHKVQGVTGTYVQEGSAIIFGASESAKQNFS
jgi:hypothetical protein